MSRANTPRGAVSRAATPATKHSTRMTWRGWNDYRKGLPFPREYDGWEIDDQRNYSRGRALAAACIGAHGKAPTWAKNRTIASVATPLPREVYAAMAAEQSFHMAAPKAT